MRVGTSTQYHQGLHRILRSLMSLSLFVILHLNCQGEDVVLTGGIRVLRGQNMQLFVPKSRQAKTSPTPAVKMKLRKTPSHIETPSQPKLERSSILQYQASEKFIPPIQATENAKVPYRQVGNSTDFSKPNPAERSNVFSQGNWQTLQPSQVVAPLRQADWNFDSSPKPPSRPFPGFSNRIENKQVSNVPEPGFVVQEEVTAGVLEVSEIAVTESKTETEVVDQSERAKVDTEEVVIQDTGSEPEQTATIIPAPPVITPSRIQVAEIVMPPMVQQPQQSFNVFGLTAMFVIGFVLAAGCLYMTGRLQQQQIPSVIKLVVQADELFSKLQLNSNNFVLETPGSEVTTTAVVDLESEPHIIPIMGHQTYTDRETEKSALQQERSEEICKALFEENLNLQKNFASA